MSTSECAIGDNKKTISDFSLRELQDAFAKYDPKETGKVATKHLKSILRSLGFEPRNDEIRLLISKITENKGRKKDEDSVTFDELVEMLSEKLDERNGISEMRSAYELFDSDAKGFITIEDLRRVAKELGETISDEHLREMLLEADSRDTGTVNEADFFTTMKKASLY